MSPSAQPHITALLGFMVPSLDLSQIEIGLEVKAVKQGLRDRWTAKLKIQWLEPVDSLSVVCYHSHCSFPFTNTFPFTFLLHKQRSMANSQKGWRVFLKMALKSFLISVETLEMQKYARTEHFFLYY